MLWPVPPTWSPSQSLARSPHPFRLIGHASADATRPRLCLSASKRRCGSTLHLVSSTSIRRGNKMADKLKIPKGRTTIRKSGSLTGLHGQKSRAIRLWPFEAKPNTTLARLEVAYMAGLDAVDQIEGRTRSSAASGRFTADGVKDDALKYAMSDLIPGLDRARTTIRKAKTEVAERRSKLKIEGPDKSDVAAAFRRREIRTFLREMKGNDQKNYFARYGDDLPGEVTMAILEMPPELSGVPKSRHDLLTTRALEAQHGTQIAEIAELEEAIASAESAVEIGRDEVRIEAGALDERTFNEMAAPIEAKHDAPWLKRSKGPNGAEEIRVVDLDRGVERPATVDEIATGIEYRDYDHFKEGRAA